MHGNCCNSNNNPWNSSGNEHQCLCNNISNSRNNRQLTENFEIGQNQRNILEESVACLALGQCRGEHVRHGVCGSLFPGHFSPSRNIMETFEPF